MLNRKTFYYLISIVITIAVFYYIFSNISIKDVFQQVRKSNFHAIIAFVCLSFIGNFCRAWRYQLLLAQSNYRCSSFVLFLIVWVRNLCADLLPAKIGSLVYIFLVNKKLGVNLVSTTSSFMISFIFDMIAIAPLVILASWEAFGSESFSLIKLIFLGLVVALCFLVVLWQLKNLLLLSGKTFCLFPFKSGLKDKVLAIIKQVNAEIDRARENKVYLPIFLLSLMVRLCKYGSLYLLLYAFLEPVGDMIEKVSIGGAFLGIFSAELAASLPVSGIAGFGAYEGAWTFTFQLLGLPKEMANITAIAHHVFTQAYGYIIGGLAMLALMFLPIKKALAEKTLFKAKSFYLSYALLFALMAAVPAVLLNFSKIQKFIFEVQYETSDVSSEEIKLALEEINFPKKAQILFDSNREGNFGIFKLNPYDGIIKKVISVENKHAIYGDVSSDGKLVTYSVPDTLAQDSSGSVWMANINGYQRRKVADNALFSTFSADNQSIYYEHKRKSVFIYDIKSRTRTRIFPSKKIPFKKGAAVVKPKISQDGKWLAFTSNHPDRWYTWFINLESGEKIKGPAGCQPIWPENTKEPYWVKTSGAGAKAGSGIFAINLSSGKQRTIEDQDKPWGHEYFPSLSPNYRYLAYSACPHYQHSHFESNYQIHIKDLKSEKTVRVQYDQYTNNWPKIFRTQD